MGSAANVLQDFHRIRNFCSDPVDNLAAIVKEKVPIHEGHVDAQATQGANTTPTRVPHDTGRQPRIIAQVVLPTAKPALA